MRIKKIVTVILSLVLVLGICNPISASAAETSIQKPTISVKLGTDNRSVEITIKKTNPRVKGYYIYMKAPNKSKYSKIKTLKQDGSKDRSFTYTISEQVEGKYYFKVKSYDVKKAKSAYSSAKKVNIQTGVAGPEPTPEPTKTPEVVVDDGKTPVLANGKIAITKPVKEYDVKNYKPFDTDKYTYNTEKLSSKISVGEGIIFEKVTVPVSDPDGSLFSQYWCQDAASAGWEMNYYGHDEEWLAKFQELLRIPTLSKTNKAGLESGNTVVGLKSIEESQQLVNKWLKEANAVELANMMLHGWTIKTATIDEDGDLACYTHEGDMLGIARRTEIFEQPVYAVKPMIASSSTNPNDAVVEALIADMQLLSFISKNPYDTVLKLFDESNGTCLYKSIYDKWYRINDLMFYHRSENNVLYAIPVD